MCSLHVFEFCSATTKSIRDGISVIFVAVRLVASPAGTVGIIGIIACICPCVGSHYTAQSLEHFPVTVSITHVASAIVVVRDGISFDLLDRRHLHQSFVRENRFSQFGFPRLTAQIGKDFTLDVGLQSKSKLFALKIRSIGELVQRDIDVVTGGCRAEGLQVVTGFG